MASGNQKVTDPVAPVAAEASVTVTDKTGVNYEFQLMQVSLRFELKIDSPLLTQKAHLSAVKVYVSCVSCTERLSLFSFVTFPRQHLYKYCDSRSKKIFRQAEQPTNLSFGASARRKIKKSLALAHAGKLKSLVLVLARARIHGQRQSPATNSISLPSRLSSASRHQLHDFATLRRRQTYVRSNQWMNERYFVRNALKPTVVMSNYRWLLST